MSIVENINKINNEISDFLKTFKINFGPGGEGIISTLNDSNKNNFKNKKFCKSSDNFFKTCAPLNDNLKKFSIKNKINSGQKGVGVRGVVKNNLDTIEKTMDSNNNYDPEDFRNSSNNFHFKNNNNKDVINLRNFRLFTSK